jgi:hypothetical protein
VSVINYVASFTRFHAEDYQRPPPVPKATHKRMKDAVRRYCNVTAFSLRNQGEWIKAFANDIARTKENLVDIINAMLEILVKESIELPAFSTLERIAYSARARANTTYFRTITQLLNPATKDTLEALLSTKTGRAGKDLQGAGIGRILVGDTATSSSFQAQRLEF